MKVRVQKQTQKKLIVSTLLLLGMVAAGFVQTSQSASLTNVSVTLSNSRLSFSGAMAAGNTTGSSQVIIDDTTGDWPSTTSAQIVSGDAFTIGNDGTATNYTVTSIDTSNTFNVTPVLEANDVDAGDIVISTQSATHTVRFTTANAIPNGSFRILVPAVSNDTDAADGLPDAGNFDFNNNGTTATVTCPNSITGYTFGAPSQSASSVTIGSQDYHAFTCSYTGSGAIGTAFDGTTNDAIVINNLVNPAPKVGHTTGLADTYRIIVQHLNSGASVADTTTTSVGIIEAVRVTASVAPQITFQINGVPSGTTACGVSTDVTTTAAAVPLGELSISAFTNAAQAMEISTNASNGYSVTALANDQMGRDAGTCLGDNTGGDCIPDSVGDNGTMSHTAEDEWGLTTVKGFGFSMDDVNVSGTTPAFEYDSTSGGCTGTYCARQFPDAEDSQTATEIFSSSTVADQENLYMCYRAIISSTQAAGNYENNITYTATATF